VPKSAAIALKPHSIPGFYEPFSAMTHLLGALVFLVFGIKLLLRARGSKGRVAYFAVYVFSGVFLLSMSGVYHMLAEGTTGRNVLGRLDYAAIFALIAGTHTPVQGLFFRGVARWLPVLLMWSAVATGVTLFSVFYHDLPYGLGNSIFLGLGWLAGLSGFVVWRRVGTAELSLLIGGGVAYSLGALLMAMDWPILIPGVIGTHELWHLAVLIAMCMHWRFLSNHAQVPISGPLPRKV
ncbi:MAG: hemolysin III family protein, partial [Planctomycetota bacterium]|nr:hemolysin III family protein [Planctomycetota bacterium]